MARLRLLCGLMANDKGDVLIVECATIHSVEFSIFRDSFMLLVKRLFGENAWEWFLDLPRRFVLHPTAIDALFEQQDLCPVALLARFCRRVFLTYDAPHKFNVVCPQDAYQHSVMFIHDTVPERADEIAEWLASNIRGKYQQIVAFRSERPLFLSTTPADEMMTVVSQKNLSNQPVYFAGPDHFPASLFCFENVNDAIHFKLRWIG